MLMCRIRSTPFLSATLKAALASLCNKILMSLTPVSFSPSPSCKVRPLNFEHIVPNLYPHEHPICRYSCNYTRCAPCRCAHTNGQFRVLNPYRIAVSDCLKRSTNKGCAVHGNALLIDVCRILLHVFTRATSSFIAAVSPNALLSVSFPRRPGTHSQTTDTRRCARSQSWNKRQISLKTPQSQQFL